MAAKRRRGRPPNLKRRRLAAKLRAQGLTEPEIGARLGITRQAVHVLLTRCAQDKVPLTGIRCGECGRLATTGYFTTKANQHVLCLRCVKRRPDTPFGTRLKAFRLAAGLTQEQLAERTGMKPSTIGNLEGRRYISPAWPHLLALVKVLGPDLVCLGLSGCRSNKSLGGHSSAKPHATTRRRLVKVLRAPDLERFGDEKT